MNGHVTMADFLDISNYLNWTDGTQVNVLIDFIEEKGLYDTLSKWAEERFAEEMSYAENAEDECPSCRGTGIGDPHSEGICRECSRREKSEPQEP